MILEMQSLTDIYNPKLNVFLGLRASLEVTGLKSACFELQVVLVTVVLPTRSINKCTRCYNAINLPSVRFTFLTVVYDVAYIC
ncbi:hypothetical protein EWB00_002620 [Schistosoma japonicum]|uniref:Uncharacterized protein n=1 Tax=Schistosoma japonicum TaxID=6182 RepID=A0A4Z2DBE7_SCHJA|nr:hypothetical protein EWB00_002620 [Schistosoma japonicum]